MKRHGKASRYLLAALFASAVTLLPHVARADCQMNLIARMPVEMRGQYPIVSALVDRKPARLVVNNGGIFNFMPISEAEKLGLKLQQIPSGTITMFNRTELFEPKQAVVQSLMIGGSEIKNVAFAVGGHENGMGEIGLGLLSAFDTEYDLSDGAISLFSPVDCKNTNLAYWAKGQPMSALNWVAGAVPKDSHWYVRVSVNGKSMRALLDATAAFSSITRSAAMRAKMAPIAGEGGELHAFNFAEGGNGKEWIARLASLTLGGEVVRNTTIKVIDYGQPTYFDVILGADFFRSHRVLAARSQKILYVSYVGGAVFSPTITRKPE